MAEFIQGQLTILHKADGGTPTEPTTKPTEEIELDAEAINDEEIIKGTQSLLGSAAVKRRLANYTIAGAERAINQSFDNRLFQESIYGDSRGMKRIQALKQNVNKVTNEVKSLVGASITTVALSNSIVLTLHLVNMASNAMSNVVQRQEEMANFTHKTNIELYENRKNQQRLIIGTYNRRGG